MHSPPHGPDPQNNILQFGASLLAQRPEIEGHVSLCDTDGRGSPLDPALALQICRESYFWGEPHLSWQNEEALLLGIALSRNQKFTGGVLMHDIVVPENHAAAMVQLLQQIGKDWMDWLVRENEINEALMHSHQVRGSKERHKGEAIHELKMDNNQELRKSFGIAEPELMLAVRRGDRPEARKLLNLLIMQAYNLAGHDFFQVRALLAEMVALLRATARECADPEKEILGFQTPFWEILRGIVDEEDLSQWLRDILESTMDLIEGSALSPGKLRARLVLDYMRMNCTGPLSRKTVAAKAGLSEAEFSRMMRRETGKTFSEQLTALRIDEACRLLRRSSLSIQEIAFHCGYEDPAYFSNVFRKWTGKTPGNFRKVHKPGSGRSEN